MQKLKILSFLLLVVLISSGCAGLGLHKKATVMPDEVWTQWEGSPNGTQRDWKSSKMIGGMKWRFQ